MIVKEPPEPLPVAINFSGGTSSTWPYWMIRSGKIKRPEHVAVFMADTGDEHEWTYEHAENMKQWCKEDGIAFIVCRDTETLSDHMLDAVRNQRTRVDNPPLWTMNPGGGRGQLIQKCTKRFKTAPIRRAQTEWLKSIGKPKQVEVWIGFAADEQARALKADARADVQWQKLRYPGIRLGAVRAQQRADLVRLAGYAPRFSACVECPFNSPDRWRAKTPDDLAKSMAIDDAVRDGFSSAGVDEQCFLSDRLVPVSQLVRGGDPQPSLPGFDPPGCDGGQCFL